MNGHVEMIRKSLRARGYRDIVPAFAALDALEKDCDEAWRQVTDLTRSCNAEMEHGDAKSQAWLDEKNRADALEAELARKDEALREIVNMLGPDHFGGELEGLVAEGNEALRVARAALAKPTGEPDG